MSNLTFESTFNALIPSIQQERHQIISKQTPGLGKIRDHLDLPEDYLTLSRLSLAFSLRHRFLLTYCVNSRH